MKEPVNRDEIVEFIKKEFPYVKFIIGKLYDKDTILIQLNQKEKIVIYPSQMNEDYNGNGKYTVGYWYENNSDSHYGHGGGMETWEELKRWFSDDLKRCNVIPTDTQLSIFDL